MDLPCFEIIRQRPGLLWILGIASVVTFFGTLIFLPLILIRIPPDYFIHSRKERQPHPRMVIRIMRVLVLILKNILGALLIVMGLVLLFAPGQGLLTLLAGILLMNFPGKKHLEIRLISYNSVFHTINRIRKRAGHEEIIRPLSEPPEKKAT